MVDWAFDICFTLNEQLFFWRFFSIYSCLLKFGFFLKLFSYILLVKSNVFCNLFKNPFDSFFALCLNKSGIFEKRFSQTEVKNQGNPCPKFFIFWKMFSIIWWSSLQIFMCFHQFLIENEQIYEKQELKKPILGLPP